MRGGRLIALPSLAAATQLSRLSSTSTMGAASFISSINTEYEALHKSFEEQFWGTKMALSDEKYSVDALTRTKGEMEAFLADEEKLKVTREHLAKGDLARTIRLKPTAT